MEHTRIDEGVKRGKKPKAAKPADIERQARNEAGKFLTRYTPELRQTAIDDCKLALECGGRIDDIADKHRIPRSTLYSWLIGEQDAGRLRTQFFDGQVARSLSEIRAAEAPLDLARADRELNGWLKVAAVRDSAAYGPKNFVQVEHVGDLGAKLRQVERVIEHDATQQEPADHAQVLRIGLNATAESGENT